MREKSRYCGGSIAHQASEPDGADAVAKERRQMDCLLSGESQCKLIANSVLRQMVLLKNIFDCMWVGVLPARCP